MIKKIIVILLCSMIMSCSKNVITGRTQYKLLPESELQSMALQQYQQIINTSKVVLSSNNRDAEMVRRVGIRITKAVTDYYASIGQSDKLKNYHWEYNLVENNEVNAWCMPGGKIVVYTGLLPVTQNEDALAVVMGHEVTHAIFNHGNERMSQGLSAQLGGAALSVALANKPAATQNLFLAAYGAGAQVGILLPFSRTHEYEADHYGLWWAAMAGYNPREAIPLWQRMEAKAHTGGKPPEFLSTHPSEGNRIAQLEKYMPEALKYYKPASR